MEKKLRKKRLQAVSMPEVIAAMRPHTKHSDKPVPWQKHKRIGREAFMRKLFKPFNPSPDRALSPSAALRASSMRLLNDSRLLRTKISQLLALIKKNQDAGHGTKAKSVTANGQT